MLSTDLYILTGFVHNLICLLHDPISQLSEKITELSVQLRGPRKETLGSIVLQ